jgi:hypothetical protein
MCSAAEVSVYLNPLSFRNFTLAHLSPGKPVSIKMQQEGSVYHLLLATCNATGVYSRTKVVELLPQFYVANRCEHALLVQPEGGRELPPLQGGAQLPLCAWPLSNSTQKLLRVRPAADGDGPWTWSGLIALEQPNEQELVPLVELQVERDAPRSTM